MTELDYMEYASDGAAQAAYVSSDASGAFDSFTKFLSHFNGSDGATTLTAETGQTITFAGNAQLDTAQKWGGASSLLLDGTGDYASLADSDDWDFGTGDFTVDFRIMLNAVENKVWFDIGSGLLNSIGVSFYYESGRMYVVFNNHYVGFSGGAGYITWTPSGSTWYHVAISRASGTVRFFINGVQNGGDVSDSENLTASTYGVKIGGRRDGNYCVNGWIDEFRISKGVARWTANFTPPATEYAASPNLQSYSESSTKKQGSYSLKVSAAQTGSLNDTVTRTVSPVIDLSNINTLKLWIRASRTGSNIKIGIHDSGGTTTEITPNIVSANTWQAVKWDISAVANSNKDAIDSIIITILNADADNTIYIDSFFAYGAPSALLAEGETNPTRVTDTTPEMSAYLDIPTGSTEKAKYYQVQVRRYDGSYTSPLWDSGKTELATYTSGRCENISYGGTALPLTGKKYFFRFRFWDENDVDTPWSED